LLISLEFSAITPPIIPYAPTGAPGGQKKSACDTDFRKTVPRLARACYGGAASPNGSTNSCFTLLTIFALSRPTR
jgi:hypothetical protein